jgi:hypothetical protein
MDMTRPQSSPGGTTGGQLPLVMVQAPAGEHVATTVSLLARQVVMQRALRPAGSVQLKSLAAPTAAGCWRQEGTAQHQQQQQQGRKQSP